MTTHTLKICKKMTVEVIRQWNETCDDWEGMFDRE